MTSKRNDSKSDASSPEVLPAVVRGRTALLLGLLGIVSFGLTSIPGLVLGISGLWHRPRGWSMAATIVSIMVLAGWLGGLFGALEVMQSQSTRPSHHWSAGLRLGRQIARMASESADHADPRPPSVDALKSMMDRVPKALRMYGNPVTPVAIESMPSPAGVLLRCRIGAPLDSSMGSAVTPVDPERGGIYLFGIDGRQIWTLERALDPERSVFDDRETQALVSTLSAAKVIIAAAARQDGVLPDAVEASRLIAALGEVPQPGYRRRPGGVFDMEVPGTRRSVTYSAFGGVFVPILP